MNYRHAFHAGNFADVFKHALFTRILLYLTRKPAPIACLDTHAGRGAYDLAQPEAARTGEWQGGIGRLDRATMPADVRALLDPYLDLVTCETGAPPSRYPGSPAIALRLLRAHDRLVANELHPQDRQALADTLGGDRRVRISAIDGYAALAAFAPPRERRGLVLVDPPCEATDEWDRMETALRQAHRKWATGVYVLWYPVKDPAAAASLAERLRDGGTAKVLRLELLVEAVPRRGAHDTLALIGCGLIVVNPPYVLEAEAAVLLPFLAARLGRRQTGAWRCERLTDAAGEGMRGVARLPSALRT